MEARHVMSRSYRYAVIALITACVPLGAQSGWQQQRSAYAQQQAPGYAQPSAYGSQPPRNPYDDADDYDDDAGGSSNGYGAGYGDSDEQDRGQPSGGHSNWTCVATGSIGTTQGNYPTLYRNKEWPDNGRTRDEAYMKALEGCNALMGQAANLGYLSGDEVESSGCKVVDCRPTGT
jgi:hypothetical protein